MELVNWLNGTNANHFVYDQTFGGVITNDGWHNKEADYGNGYYNDHHVRDNILSCALLVVNIKVLWYVYSFTTDTLFTHLLRFGNLTQTSLRITCRLVRCS